MERSMIFERAQGKGERVASLVERKTPFCSVTTTIAQRI
jgi:hypothetical protein